MSADRNQADVDKMSGSTNGDPPLPAAKTAEHGTDRAGHKSIIREYTEAIIVAMLLAFTIRVFVVQAFKIPSGSMIPTLLIGDHILVSKLSYGLQWPSDCKLQWNVPPVNCYTSRTLIEFGKPQRGDIIVFRFPEDEEKDFIKRIVGLPGDTVQIRNKVVLVNGQPLDDRAFTQRVDPSMIDGAINPRDNFGPVTVPEGSYFVMGDNRDQSLDSRFWGYVREEKIRGKAFRIYWSWNGQGNWTEWVRWERLGKAIR
ncbi:signal peptidase I [Candidatus Nitrospira inopinata]|jgi:signal peptidase I|uniref:Signal peptidase I n=1 Tax=Candidatus Nitrospira inopinata TaxID=1715989 RepID=A0A0S4KZP2_9BACT|nr:signal peptidase I [Candidatus Nitrospira inopinata]CUQ67844.1 Signal peptidase I [Candidatus Nitrospira inopinata]